MKQQETLTVKLLKKTDGLEASQKHQHLENKSGPKKYHEKIVLAEKQEIVVVHQCCNLEIY